MTDDVVLYEARGPAAWVTLNRPEKLNALTRAIVAGLHLALDRALADDEIKIVVLTGAGRAFSSGFDIEQDAGVEGADAWRDVLEADVAVIMHLRELPKPTIAAVRGWCSAARAISRSRATSSSRPRTPASASRRSASARGR